MSGVLARHVGEEPLLEQHETALPPMTADEQRAFLAERFRLARLVALVTAPMGAVLVLAWSAFDRALEPAWLEAFVTLRLLYVGMALVIFVAAWRTKSQTAVQIYQICPSAFAMVVIFPMMPRVEHYGLYALGLSAAFWSLAVFPYWKVPEAIAAYAVLLCDHVLTHFIYAGPRALGDLLAVTAYLAVASGVGVFLAYVRRPLELRNFRLGYRVELESRRLTQTLESLKHTQARMAISEKLTASGRLLAGFSHELNNPANAVQNNVKPLQDYMRALRAVAALAPSEERAEVDSALAEAEAALLPLVSATAEIRAVHRDLRSFVRADATGDLVATSPGDGVAATTAMVRRTLPASVQLEVDIADTPAALHRPGQLNQALFNVLRNAAQAVGSRGRIRVRAFAGSGAVAIEVADSGPGIAAEVLPHIFEPFFTTHPPGSASGLGLASAREVLESMGGAIDVQPHGELGGATFTLRLRLARSEAA